MTPTEVEHYLHEHIPLSGSMRVSVLAVAPERVVLSAPLAPNINHRETVFGGSASALAILAAWSLLHARLSAEGVKTRLVIQRNSMEYLGPIPGAFTARASLEAPTQWPLFKRMLDRKGKARVAVTAVLEHEGDLVGRFAGEFVALGT
ncbi:thioesterase domain-containing protein [Schlegelella sp. S2-27]|uniref:Thioesterase domain-containing protein n=1 Tax=Caldimonas mangrovi TaxID=2944811 RepID=A0ABT0YUN4_9BURK|nr:YiiD C-terminal domain-containing protein [Caldimonas mangrovi]MCM5682461.1 thioesterase domain-containing protein [Caldimonas mangrovi]